MFKIFDFIKKNKLVLLLIFIGCILFGVPQLASADMAGFLDAISLVTDSLDFVDELMVMMVIVTAMIIVTTTGCVATAEVSSVTTYVTADEHQQKLIDYVNENRVRYASDATMSYNDANHLDWNPNLKLIFLDEGFRQISLEGDGYYIGPVLYVTESGEEKIHDTSVYSSPGYSIGMFAKNATKIYTLQEPPKFIDEIINP